MPVSRRVLLQSSVPAGISLLAAQAAWADPYIFEIPFEWGRESPMLILQASINGAAPAPFVFDTGFEATVVLNESFPGLQVTPQEGQDSKDGKPALKALKPFKMAIKGAPNDLEITMQDAYQGRIVALDEFYGKGKIAGVLGAGILHFLKLAIDFDTKKIRLGANCSREAMGWTNGPATTKLRLEKDGGSKIAPVVRLLPESDGAYFGSINTGSNLSVFSGDLLKKYTAKKSKISTTSTGAKPVFAEELYRVANYALTGEKQDVVVRQGAGNKNLIGLDYLSQSNFYIDYPNQEMLLLPRKSSGKIRGYRGFSVAKKDGKLVVDYVHPGYVSVQTLEVGDEVILPDSQATTRTLLQLSYMLDGYEGEEREIKIARKGKTESFTYKIISLF